MLNRYKFIAAAGGVIAALAAVVGFTAWRSGLNVSGPADTNQDQLFSFPGAQPALPENKPAPSSTPGSYRGKPVEALDPDYKFLSQVPEATYKKSLEELVGLSSRIKENPRDYQGWMRAAHIKHFYGDEIGTRDIYEYLNLVFDEHPLPFYNLALLYGYYLKEPAKAIPKYQSAIERNPAEASYYIGLADFYREVLGDLKSAETVLLAAEKIIQGNVNIPVALGALYKTMGNISKSIEYYELVLVRMTGGGAGREAIRAEVERLKQLIRP